MQNLATGTPLEYAYDRRGLRTGMSMGVPGGEAMSVTYGYDDAMRLTVVRSDKDAAPAQYVYDAAGRRIALVLPNGVRTRYTYDGSDRLQELVTTDAQGETLASFAYTLDAVGNRTAIDMVLSGATTKIDYAFDDAYRLTRETRTGDHEYAIGYAYDAVGNRLTQTRDDGQGAATTNYAYNSRNQLVSETSGSTVKSYSYDNNGNTTHIGTYEGGVLTGQVSQWYDALNRMGGWQKQDAQGQPLSTETHSYAGAEWHRISTTVDSGATTSYLYDGDNVVADIAGSGAGVSGISRLYITPFLDQNLSMYDLTGVNGGTPGVAQAFYYSQDGLGSVRTVTDAAGVVKNAYDFTAFGEPYQPNTNVTVPQRYTYTGRESSSVDGPMYYRYRMYDSAVGRFTARDPIGYAGAPDGNLYAYANLNPLYFVDPLGNTAGALAVGGGALGEVASGAAAVVSSAAVTVVVSGVAIVVAEEVIRRSVRWYRCTSGLRKCISRANRWGSECTKKVAIPIFRRCCMNEHEIAYSALSYNVGQCWPPSSSMCAVAMYSCLETWFGHFKQPDFGPCPIAMCPAGRARR